MKTWWIAGCALILLGVGRGYSANTLPRHGERYELNLAKKVERYDVNNADMLGVLQNLVVHGVSVSAEVADPPGLKISFSMRDASLREILDALVEKFPGYEWKAHGGIVRIFSSASARKENSFRLLNEKIPSFSSDGLGTTGTIGYLGQEARKHGISASTGVDRSSASWAESAELTPVDAKLTINIDRKTSLREILNKIIAADPPSYWVAYPMPDGKLAFFGGSGHTHREESPRNKK
jgi:hypothetical protein